MKFFMLLSLLLYPTIALSHEGHGGYLTSNILHYFADPTHLALPLLGIALVLWAMRSKVRSSIRQYRD